ncbi:hypothetical protein SAMN05444008_12345 [Cnuella takakiae]|uniref:Beta-lactamase-inhibitor-like, PepSY-like n=1 Tax=Cnuella takakiae TaxID=1302690 RepID=A0A1M5IDT0_9BACT|nr:hypothetical protein [Cnuella takakiae]OLY90812.1 hypothetical protein BUE76_02040 [Cnuella takakiae]SHG26442.1 hypothetical protein SAMN05444008_12345 [Cnuella takakiae]
MKKLFIAAAMLVSLSSFAGPGVDEELERHFRETFPAANAIKWYDSKEGYEVFFTLNNIQCRIQYDADGTMKTMRRDYTKESLPMFITGAVNKKYPGKKIFGVTELTTPSGLQYHIVLQDEKSWYFVDGTSGGDLSLNHKLHKN